MGTGGRESLGGIGAYLSVGVSRSDGTRLGTLRLDGRR